MKRDIIRVHQHASEIILTKCVSDLAVYYQKASYSPEGISEIKNEYDGYNWYFDRSQLKGRVKIIVEMDGYCSISIPNFDALPCSSRLEIEEIFDYGLKAIDHYKEIWGANANKVLQPIHGDYSLEGNILFNDANTYLIDWEHFSVSAAPLGFDILYMVFELIKLKVKNSIPNTNQLEIAKKLIDYADKIGVLSKLYIDNYFEAFLAEQEKIKFVWKEQYAKLPTTQFTKLQSEAIINYFNYKNHNVKNQQIK